MLTQTAPPAVSEREAPRLESLAALVPKGRATLLDVGARDGRVTMQLAPFFREVTALDLETPQIELPNVTCFKGDATRLDFPDRAFDVVVCSEVIEHIPDVQQACRELRRVARHELLIGVPYRQDLRVKRITCLHCGLAQNAYGHLHSFDEHDLERLFALPVAGMHFVGQRHRTTTALGCALMDAAGNPWGNCGQQEFCLRCGHKLARPAARSPFQRSLGALALTLEKAATAARPARAGWIHILFSKD